MINNLTFGGYPITLEIIDNVVHITCKGVTGTEDQVLTFLRNKTKERYKFGNSYIKSYPKQKVRIDCLTDTKTQVKFIYQQTQKFKYERRNNKN